MYANSLCDCRQAMGTWVLAPQHWRGEGLLPPNVVGTPAGWLSCSFIYGEMATTFRAILSQGALRRKCNQNSCQIKELLAVWFILGGKQSMKFCFLELKKITVINSTYFGPK